MADFPRYDGHLYIDAYEGNIVRDWYVGRDLYVSDDAEITNNLTVTAGNFRVNAGTATVYGDITTTTGDFIALDGDATLTNSTASAHGLTITSTNVLGEPTISLTEQGGLSTTLKTNTTGQTELYSGAVKVGFTGVGSVNLFAGAGTDPFASQALQVRTISATGTTYNSGELVVNASGDDTNFAVKTDGYAFGSFTIDAGTGVAEFNSPMIVKTNADVYHKTPTYNTDFNPAIRINAASESYTNKLLTLFTNDFSVETTSFTGVTPAFRLNYASDTLTVRVPTTIESTLDVTGLTTTAGITNVGTIQNTGPLDNTGIFTQIGTANITGTLNQDGDITFSNTTTNTPNLTVNDGTLNIKAWEFSHDAGDMQWKINPDSDSAFEFKVYSQNGLPDVAIDEGGTGVDGRFTFYGEKFQLFPRPVGDGGQGGYVEYYISDGTKVMEWNLQDAAVTASKGYRFDVKDSITGAGKFELNTTSQSDMDFVVNTSTIADAFYIDYGDDSLAFKGILAEPFPTYSDTATNLATTLTKQGAIAYDTTNSELAMRSNGSNSYVLTPLVHSFTFDFPNPSVTVAGPFNPVANGLHAKSGVTALWDGYIVGFSVEVENVPGIGVLADFRPRVNATNLTSLSAVVNATGNFEATATAAPNAVSINSGDRLTAALEQIIGSPSSAMGETLAQLYVVYKIPVL